MRPRFCALLLHPRGLAAETASVMSFSNHELLRGRLMLALSSPAPDQRYQLPSFKHVLSSDQKAWSCSCADAHLEFGRSEACCL